MIAKVTQRTEFGPLVALPTARRARVEHGNRLSPTQSAQLCMDCSRRSSSCGSPKLVPLFNESGKLVPTSHRWGHQQEAWLRPGFFYRNRGIPESPGIPARFNCAVDGVPRRHRLK